MRFAALILLSFAGSALAQNPCDECRNAALAKSAICHQAALHPGDGTECTARLQGERERCQEQACKSEAETRLYALCPECAKLTGEGKVRCEKNLCAPPPKTAPGK
ncbi:MAG TPA: hypothetical protein VM051_13845 [Usitatibacter sp.]|nr:hypothetical protein [Usitatibacter sp.]